MLDVTHSIMIEVFYLQWSAALFLLSSSKEFPFSTSRHIRHTRGREDLPEAARLISVCFEEWSQTSFKHI